MEDYTYKINDQYSDVIYFILPLNLWQEPGNGLLICDGLTWSTRIFEVRVEGESWETNTACKNKETDVTKLGRLHVFL